MKIFCLVILVFIIKNAFTQTITDTNFKIVGYYSLHDAASENVMLFPFAKLTHVNLYFLNPDTAGDFRENLKSLVPFIETAHKKNVKVLVSVGGGGRHAYYTKLLNSNNRSKFIKKLVSIIGKYNLDGVDVDLEDKDIDENYDNFIIELSTALHQHKKIITAAIAIYFKESYTDKVLEQFDFVNLMSYDHTAAWKPLNPGPHASYAQAVSDLDYFRNVRLIPKYKITLGVPFYGYGFGPHFLKHGLTINYTTIVKEHPGAEMKDELTTLDSTSIFYNGIPTIKLKTELAKRDAGGVMIWQLSADAPSPYSLLDAIDEAAKQ